MSTIKLSTKFSADEIKHEAPVIKGVHVWTHSNVLKQKKHRKPMTALINTGADVTQVPDFIIKDVGEDTGKVMKLSAPEAKIRIVNLHRLRFSICGKEVETEWAVSVKSDYIDLGRDVLRRYTLSVCWPVLKSGKLELP